MGGLLSLQARPLRKVVLASMFACCGRAGAAARRQTIRASEFEDRDGLQSALLTGTEHSDDDGPRGASMNELHADPLSPEFSAVRAEARRALEENFDYASADHAALTTRLFKAVFPRARLNSELISTEWKTMGFQRSNPAPDFRSSGLFGLRLLIYFFETYPEAGRLIVETHRPREPRHYPVAAAGIALSALIADLLQLRVDDDAVIRTPLLCELSQWLRSMDDVGEMFSALLVHFEDQWQVRGAVYMTFQDELRRLRRRLEDAVPRPRDADARAVPFNRNMFEERLNDDSLLADETTRSDRCAIM
eukprot:Amastigsp_a841096_406.p2 type:complete len:306 gc:universal Amastigsp_a841096_406:1-918(+)